MEITETTTDEQVRDYMRVEHWAGRKPKFFSKIEKYIGKRLYSYLIEEIKII